MKPKATGWRRCTKQDPCPICKKPDWCSIGARYIHCMRVASTNPVSTGGWLHEIEGAQAKPLPPKERQGPTINASQIMQEWLDSTSADQLCFLSQELGLPASSLLLLNPAWSKEHHAWAFPMSDPYGNYVGIRLRDSAGRKWAVKGSHQGLFLPTCEPQETVYICEGPTDTAAALSMGFYAVGRPSCLGCEGDIFTLIKRKDIRKAVIVADNDDPGTSGARKLAAGMKVPSIIMYPPAKDLREFVSIGGTASLLHSMWGNFVWSAPQKVQDQ